MKRQSNLHDEKEVILRQFLNVNQLEASGGMFSREILKLRSLKSLETCIIFLFIFASSKFSCRVTKLHERGHFVRVFEKW